MRVCVWLVGALLAFMWLLPACTCLRALQSFSPFALVLVFLLPTAWSGSSVVSFDLPMLRCRGVDGG